MSNLAWMLLNAFGFGFSLSAVSLWLYAGNVWRAEMSLLCALTCFCMLLLDLAKFRITGVL